MTLTDRLQALYESDMLPLHMPGHKRSSVIPAMSDIYSRDITEIDGFDDLHAPMGIIADMQRRAAMLYGADRAWLSVNGSSAALEAAILATCRPGDEIILARASHKSVYFAIEVGRLTPVYIAQSRVSDCSILNPPSVSEVASVCEAHPHARCVVITTPTYEGLMADVREIAREVHRRGMTLIVDGAHGAHLGFGIGDGMIEAGADLAIVSLHKMLPAPTQTALLLASRSMADTNERISHYMQVFQSSSPSYVLMSGIDECLHYIADRLKSDIRRTLIMAADMRKDLSGLAHFDISLHQGADPYKVVIRSKMPGAYVYGALRDDFHIQCEMYGTDYVLAMFGPADDEDAFARLKDALLKLDEDPSVSDRADTEHAGSISDMSFACDIPKRAMIPAEAIDRRNVESPLSDVPEGSVSASYICPYPPGIPIVVPGEIIDRKVKDLIGDLLKAGLKITGIDDDKILIVREDE